MSTTLDRSEQPTVPMALAEQRPLSSSSGWGGKVLVLALGLMGLAAAAHWWQRHVPDQDVSAAAVERSRLPTVVPPPERAAEPDVAPLAPPPPSVVAQPPRPAPRIAGAPLAPAPSRMVTAPVAAAPSVADQTSPAPGDAHIYATAAVCLDCGWVESVNYQPPTDAATTAAMAAAGANAGAASVRGASAGGPIAATAAGAVMGAQAGAKGGTGGRYELRIRMQDGSLRVVYQAEPLPLGASVVMDGPHARLAARPAPAAPAGGKVYGTR